MSKSFNFWFKNETNENFPTVLQGRGDADDCKYYKNKDEDVSWSEFSKGQYAKDWYAQFGE